MAGPIIRQRLLVQKPSGNYSCPHFVPPDAALAIARSVGKDLDGDAAKALAEIAENFAAELLRECSSDSPTATEIRELTKTIALG